jgi:ABC-type dipeptide/oligopeptide/nickel transport system ATPase subunit
MKFGPLNLLRPGVLHINNLSIDLSHDVYHLWGENGVGKSTLLKLLLNECITKGITFAFVDQNYRSSWLWWQSIEQNLKMPLVNSGLNLFDMPEYHSQRSWLEPLITDTRSQLSGPGLSGGQLQRVIMFRELLLKPKLVLLDEAFSALDFEVIKQQTAWLLEQQAQIGFTLISIAHDKRILDCLPGTIIHMTLDSDTKELRLQYD